MSDALTTGEPTAPMSVVAEREPVTILAALSEEQFGERLRLLKLGQARLQQIQREILVREVDYDTIPGTARPSLLKPGAEKLVQFYRLVPTYETVETFGDGKAGPHIRVRTTCRLHVMSKEGPVVAEATAGCTSWERRYRYRRGERSCPDCGNVGAVIKSKYKPFNWLCFKAKGGCGVAFPSDDARFKAPVGDVENPDPYDGYNTYLRVAEKRAFVAATKAATAGSGLFLRGEDDETAAEEQAAEAAAAEETPKARKPGDPAEAPEIALLVDEARRAGVLKELFEMVPALRKGGATVADVNSGWAWMEERGRG